MCAAMALPLRPLKSSCHASVPPVAVFVTVAVNVPRAELTSPLGFGVSFAAVIVAASLMVVAWLLAAAPPTAAKAKESTTAPASSRTLRIQSSSVSGIALGPQSPVVRQGETFGLRQQS